MFIARVVPLFALAATLVAPCAAGAQTAPPPAPAPAASAPAGTHHHHRHRNSLMHSLRSLHLTAAQQSQVASFRAAAKQANQNADPATREANGRKLHSQIMGILTPDQQAQLKAQRHQNGARSNVAPAANPQPSPSGQ